MKEKELLSLREASRKLGKSPTFLSTLKANKPQLFEGIPFHKIGTARAIDEESLNEVICRYDKIRKKEGDHVKNRLLGGLRKQTELLFSSL